MPTYIHWSYSLLFAIGAFVLGSFVRPYLGKKGENLATKQDIEKLTRVQEEIKKQISGRQRMWELKREVAYDILKITGTIGHLFTIISSANKTIRGPDTSEPYRLKLRNDLVNWQARFDESLEALWQIEGTSQIYYDLRISYALQRLINAGAGLHATSISESDNDRLAARNEFIAVRTEIIGLLQEQLKADA